MTIRVVVSSPGNYQFHVGDVFLGYFQLDKVDHRTIYDKIAVFFNLYEILYLQILIGFASDVAFIQIPLHLSFPCIMYIVHNETIACLC